MNKSFKRPLPMPTLSTLCIEYLLHNLAKLTDDNRKNMRQLPEHLKNRMLHKFTSSAYFWRNIQFEKVFETFIDKNTKQLDLTTTTVSDEILKLIEECINLRKLHLNCVGKHLITTQGLLNLIPQLKHIHLLRISNCDRVDDDVIECIAVHCSELSGLDVGGCFNVTDKSVKLLADLHNLKWLTFNRTQVSNYGIECLIRGHSGKNLKELRISRCPNITDLVLKPISEICENLEVLTFYNCQRVADQTDFTLQEGRLKNLKQMDWTIQW